MNSIHRTIIATGFLAAISLVQASPITFKIGGGTPAQQIATVESVTDFETFTGRSDDLKGSITFDPVAKTGSGKIQIGVASLDTGIPTRNQHLQSETWLDAAKFPSIVFESTSVKSLGGDKFAVTGKFTLHGVTKTITTNATVKYLKASDSTRKANFKGDVLQIKTSFKIKISDYGIKIAGPATGKVSDTVTISATAYAQSGG
jgi:polyisoprenoid-binding protein YceI